MASSSHASIADLDGRSIHNENLEDPKGFHVEPSASTEGYGQGSHSPLLSNSDSYSRQGYASTTAASPRDDPSGSNHPDSGSHVGIDVPSTWGVGGGEPRSDIGNPDEYGTDSSIPQGQSNPQLFPHHI